MHSASRTLAPGRRPHPPLITRKPITAAPKSAHRIAERSQAREFVVLAAQSHPPGRPSPRQNAPSSVNKRAKWRQIVPKCATMSRYYQLISFTLSNLSSRRCTEKTHCETVRLWTPHKSFQNPPRQHTPPHTQKASRAPPPPTPHPPSPPAEGCETVELWPRLILRKP